jgi:hypothetical protein
VEELPAPSAAACTSRLLAGDDMLDVEGESDASVVAVGESAVVPTATDDPAGAPPDLSAGGC